MKKAQIEYIVEFVFAVLILAIIVIFINIAGLGVIFGFVKPAFGAELKERAPSAVCPIDLLNFLRAQDSETGLTFAELAALNPDIFEKRARVFFDKYYKRGFKSNYQLELLSAEKLVLAKIGGPIAPNPLHTCYQRIPASKSGEYLTLKLLLEE